MSNNSILGALSDVLARLDELKGQAETWGDDPRAALACAVLTETGAPQGVYLELFHGRADPDEDLDDWGEEGPVFGPYEYIQTSYATHLKMWKPGPDEGLHELCVDRGLVFYGGRWYGDWLVFLDLTPELAARLQFYDETKAQPPATTPEEGGDG